MVDIAWPLDLAPYKVAFYLQAHVGGQESPITRTTKKYGLSRPRWVARLSFRAGSDGAPAYHDQLGFGPRLDSLIADLRGGLNKAVFHDWRRPRPTRPVAVMSALTITTDAAIGDESIRVSGFARNSAALSVGDYVGGDGRLHLVSTAATLAAGGRISGAGSVMVDVDGVAIIGINPPLSAPVSSGQVLTWPVTGRFELVSEDAGQNETEVGQPTEYVLDFAEDLL